MKKNDKQNNHGTRTAGTIRLNPTNLIHVDIIYKNIPKCSHVRGQYR